jgi:photosystem II CP47 chlorophyll apoprotein
MLRFRCIPRNRLFGPGIWVSDAYGITGKYSQHHHGARMVLTRSIQVVSQLIILQLVLGIFAGVFHLTVRPPQRLYRALRMGNIETVLSSSISAVFLLLSSLQVLWYGAAAT